MGPRYRGRARWLAAALATGLVAVLPVVTADRHAGASASGPALLEADAVDSGHVDVAWTPVASASSYEVFRDGVLLVTANTLRSTDTSVAAGSTHDYSTRAIVAGQETTDSPHQTVTVPALTDTRAPTAVTNLKATSIGAKSVALSWSASTDDVGVIAYFVKVGGTVYGRTEGPTSLTVSPLQASTTYGFDVYALDASGKLSTPTQITVTTAPLASPDTVKPTIPTLTATPYSDTAVDLSWSASSDTNLAGYLVGNVSTFQILANLPANSSFQTRVLPVTGLSAGTSYTFAVWAYDAAGNLSDPSIKAATTLAPGDVRVARGPYVQRADAASARVVWRTNVPAPSQLTYSYGAINVTVQDPTPRTDHSVLIGPLPAVTRVSYTLNYPTPVGGGFVTCDTGPGNERIDVAGDFGGGSPQEKAIAGLIAGDQPDFILGLGDDVYPAGEDKDFPARFLTPYATALRGSAFWTSFGNHEYYDPGASGSHLAYTQPGNESYYSFDCSGIHVAVIDTEIPYAPGSRQNQWLASDLGATTQPWKIAVLHRPPYSSSANSGPSATSILSPLFEQNGVKLVLGGHSHNYERTNPVNGVTYIVTGGGGNGLNSFSGTPPAWSAYHAAEFEYVRLNVTPTLLTGTEIRQDATTGDTFSIAGPVGTPPDTVIDSGPPTQTNATAASFAFHATQTGATFQCALDAGAATACTSPKSYTGLAQGPHAFSVQATTTSGTDPTPATASWTVDTTAPTPPSGLVASAPTSAAVNLAWTAASDANGIAGYDITRNGAPLVSVSGSTTSYTDTTVAAGTTYQYQVVARDPAGNVSAPSNTASVTTPNTVPPVFADGFESGNLSAWTSSGGLVVQGALTHTGSFAAQGNTTNGATYAKKTLPATYADAYARVFFNVVSAASQVNLLRIRTAADTSIGYLFVTATGQVGLKSDVALTTFTSATSAGAGWHSLELHAVLNGTSSTTEVWLDGVKLNDLSVTTNLGTTPIGRLQIGEVQSGRTYNVVLDDAVFATARIGP